MNAKEKKLVALSAGAGVVVTMLVTGLLMGKGLRTYAAEKVSSSTPAARPIAAQRADRDEGTQPGTTLELTPAEITAAGVQVAEVRTAALKTDIDAFGRVEQPEAQLAAVSARILRFHSETNRDVPS